METIIGVLMIAIPVLIIAFFIAKNEIEAAKKQERATQESGRVSDN